MDNKISVVINTFNEADRIEKLIKSLSWADEILVCDMHSDDETGSLAKKYGAKVVLFKRSDYVEPARNFAISSAKYNWIFILDADEEVPSTLVDSLKDLQNSSNPDFVRIARKN